MCIWRGLYLEAILANVVDGKGALYNFAEVICEREVADRNSDCAALTKFTNTNRDYAHRILHNCISDQRSKCVGCCPTMLSLLF